jgi:hypothetical protein
MKNFKELTLEQQAILQSIRENYYNFKSIIDSGKIVIDKGFMLKAVKENGGCLEYASAELRNELKKPSSLDVLNSINN